MPASPAPAKTMPDDRLLDLVTNTLATARGASERGPAVCKLDAIEIIRSARVAGLIR